MAFFPANNKHYGIGSIVTPSIVTNYPAVVTGSVTIGREQTSDWASKTKDDFTIGVSEFDSGYNADAHARVEAYANTPTITSYVVGQNSATLNYSVYCGLNVGCTQQGIIKLIISFVKA